MQDKEYIEEEIDLRELFRIIWNKRLFVIIFTAIVTFMALLYVFIKTPVYEVKSVVRIGYIAESLVENSNIIEKKLRLIFNVDNKQTITKEKAIVSNISAVKKVDNFLEISTQAFSNKKALEKNKEVVSFLQNEYKYKIDEYILKTNTNIKNLEYKINYIENVVKINILKDIEKIKIQSIPRIEKEINLIKTVELKSIDNKLEFNQKKLKEYENDIIRIAKQKSSDNTQNMFMSVQVLNAQNLILNLQSQIENLKKEKENIIDLKLKDLEQKKDNLIDENVRKLEIKLKLETNNEINNLNDQIKIEKLKLTNNLAKNSEIVGTIQTNDNPIKPKKALIIVVAFVTGFILAIFIVFFMQFISGFREKISE